MLHSCADRSVPLFGLGMLGRTVEGGGICGQTGQTSELTFHRDHRPPEALKQRHGERFSKMYWNEALKAKPMLIC